MKGSIRQSSRAIRRSLGAIARSYVILIAVFGAFLLALAFIVVVERFFLGLT
jgi:hypothetical protein